MNELTGITIAALHDERWVRERSDQSRRYRRRRRPLDDTGRDGRPGEATKASWWHRAPR
jgi:hypothetical protein